MGFSSLVNNIVDDDDNYFIEIYLLIIWVHFHARKLFAHHLHPSSTQQEKQALRGKYLHSRNNSKMDDDCSFKSGLARSFSYNQHLQER